MGKTLLMLVVLAALPAIAWSQRSGAPSNDDAAANAQTQKASKSVEGEFTKLDNQKHVLWIKTNEGKEMGFSFTDRTPIEGAKGPVQVGSRLKVYYEPSQEGSETMAALRIEVESQPS